MQYADRVKLSQRAADRGMTKHRPADRLGTVVGFSRDGSAARVLWDGRQSPEDLSVHFLECVTEPMKG